MIHKHYNSHTLESIARNLIKSYNQLLFMKPTAIPVEDIMEQQYGLTIMYQHIRNNGRILGETAFDDTWVAVYDKEDSRYLWLPVERGTVIIDAGLLNPRSKGRLRFTLAHELAHWVLHQGVYAGSGQTAAMLEKTAKSSEVDETIERQADLLGSIILMPANQVKLAFNRLRFISDIVSEMANIFEVSKQAMKIRLQSLGLIER